MQAESYANPVFRRPAADVRPRLDLQVAGRGASDVVVFYAEEGATTGADARYDAWKIPTSSLLSISTLAGPERLSIQGLPASLEAQLLPLTLTANQAATYTFSAVRLLNLPATAVVELQDRLTGKVHDLRSGGAYSVQLTAGTTRDRFFLLLDTSLVTSSTTGRNREVLLYPNPSQGLVHLSAPATGRVTITVLNSIGQVVHTQTALASNGVAATDLRTNRLPGGMYSVQISSAAGIVTSKLVVR
ncbi:T9SS type A sorting domain-containing protein [Hymenobacter sp. BT18]|uniref:T9SS type A sorting domain-containing protein n=1 Tax=Hymenobacter sp. BT18 TaxID=2835648 RepID=UPI00143E34FC|nr:T9SS type A sorting domain-containing protein [Hymenobacter sp. BT18]QIX61797.1 T9SS type A sorting domain-containing protein [Hymenobacter sp. BT18]